MDVRSRHTELADWGGGSSHYERGLVHVFQLLGDHPSQLCLEGGRRKDVVFVLVMEYWTSSLSSEGYSKVRGSLLSLHVVDLGKGFSCIPLHVL